MCERAFAFLCVSAVKIFTILLAEASPPHHARPREAIE
jgi:hypothetical protein